MSAPNLRSLLRSRVAGGVALAVGTAIAALGVVTFLDDDGGGPTADADDVRLVEDFATAVTTFDADRVDADIDRILDFGTSDFAADFRASMGETFVADLRASGASSVGEIVAGPTIQRTEGSTAVYFVVVNQRIIAPSSTDSTVEDTTDSTTPATPTPESRTVRVGLLVQLDRDADLVSSVEVL